MATDLRKPSTSVNQSRTNRMSRSSRVRSTNSCCLSMPPILPPGCFTDVTRAQQGGAAAQLPIVNEDLPSRRHAIGLNQSREIEYGLTVPRVTGPIDWSRPMDQAQTSPRTMVTALLAALVLALLTLVIALGLPSLASDVAGNGWHSKTGATVAGNGWHTKT